LTKLAKTTCFTRSRKSDQNWSISPHKQQKKWLAIKLPR